MKLFVQAVHTVSVELTGVVLLVWLLFAVATWGMRSLVNDRPAWSVRMPPSTQTWGEDLVESRYPPSGQGKPAPLHVDAKPAVPAISTKAMRSPFDELANITTGSVRNRIPVKCYNPLGDRFGSSRPRLVARRRFQEYPWPHDRVLSAPLFVAREAVSDDPAGGDRIRLPIGDLGGPAYFI